MTVRFQTQCPRCYTLYPMPEAKLNDNKARATCGKCQHTFFLNLHLVNQAPSAMNAINPAPPRTPPLQAIPQAQQQAPVVPPQKTAPVSPETVIDSITNEDTIMDEEDFALPNIPTRKKTKQKPIVKEGMIFDDMQGEEQTASDELDLSDLDDFLKNDIVIETPVVAATAKDSGQHNEKDEAWADDLLKNNEVVVERHLVKNNPNDSMSGILGEDINSFIPVAQPNNESTQDIHQKIKARLESQGPTQEQLVKRRSLGGQLGWFLGCIFLLIGLVAQYAFFNTNKIIKNPAQAQHLQTVCAFLPCNLPTADSTGFDTQHEVRSSTTGNAELLITLTNTSDNKQLYPNLKVTLSNEYGIAGEFVSAPKDYLATQELTLAPQNHRTVLLAIELPAQSVANVKIEPFY